MKKINYLLALWFKLIYQNNLLNWDSDKLKFPSEMVLIKYFTNTNYIGSNKIILTK
jgi:hypothetical protein